MMAGVFRPPESAYNLIPGEQEREERAARYTSRFREQVKLEKKLSKTSNKTMGPAKVGVPSPGSYLLKHSKEPKLPEKKPFSYGDDGHPRKPRLPAKAEKLSVDTQTKKDFITTNAIENIMAVPHQHKPVYADTKHGDKHLLENSGLVPKYLMKKDYGQTPDYLQQRREEVRRAQEEYDNFVKEKMQEGAMKQLSEEERQNIVHGLKKNWDEIHHQYQALSVVTDTTLKKYKKERLEMEMRQLEKDIELMERYKTVYIPNH